MGIIGKQFGHEPRLDDDGGTGEKARSLRVSIGAEPEDRRRIAQRLREVRHRRDPDAACDEQRPLDIQVEAVAERAEHVDCIAGPEIAQRTRPRADRVEEEGKLAGRRLAEAHRPRQHTAGRLEHEELAGRARLDRAAREPQQGVRPDRSAATTAKRSLRASRPPSDRAS